jgi:site-specific DNA recombinase
VPVDPIIEPAMFDAAQARLKSRNPKQTPPRVVTGPILLTGLATCATCGGGMTLRTGKSGRYRYDPCANCAQKGKSACPGRSVPMDKLDQLVTDQLNASLFTPDRVRALLGGLLARQTARSEDHTQRVSALQNKLSESEARPGRLYAAIENGVADATDPTLKERLAALRDERDQAKATLDRVLQELRPETRITEETIAAFTALMKENVANGPIPFRRAYLRSVIDQVEVDDTEIRIHGRRDVLERLVMGGGTMPAGVPSFVGKWRTRQDSNL